MVLARGLMEGLMPDGPPTLLATEFLRTLAALLGGRPVVLSLRPVRGREEVAPCWCSFCWCRRSKSRRAKHRVHCGHSNGFSLVCERSCRFRCSRRANERWHVPHTWGRGLSVFGGGKEALFVVGEGSGLAVWTGAAWVRLSVAQPDRLAEGAGAYDYRCWHYSARCQRQPKDPCWLCRSRYGSGVTSAQESARRSRQ
jgi:hypothetical protein